jgi:Galactose oxidase, central domain
LSTPIQPVVAGDKDLMIAGPASAQTLSPADALFTFSDTGSLNIGRLRHTATLLPNGKVLVAGGQGTSGFLTSADLYDPASGTWGATDSLTTARSSHTATLLPNGKVLVAGGAGNGGALSSAELYDIGLGFMRPDWQPQIETATSPLVLGSSLVLTG